MRTASVERLDDLIAVARRLQDLLDNAQAFPMARLLIDVDDAVGRLERRAAGLEATGKSGDASWPP